MRLAALVLGQALVLGALAATTWSAGQLVLGRWLRRRGEPAPWPMVLAAGLAALGQLALLLALAGQLRAIPVLVIVAAANAAAIVEWRGAIGRLRARVRASRAGHSPPPRRMFGDRTRRLAVAVALAIIGCPAFVLALYPPLGFDQTLYHLPFARAFAESGGLPVLPALRFPVFPQLAELLNAAILLFADDVATQTTGVLAVAGCAGLVFAWAREQTTTAGGFVAAAMLAGSPIAAYLAATGYVEPLVALFGVGSLYAAERARTHAGRGWAVVAGGLAGSAASVKYLGLFFVAAAALLLLRRGPWRPVGRQVMWYGVAALAALGPTYARLIVLTGNPLFPLLPAIFGSSAWDAQSYVRPQGATHPAAALTFLWDVTFRRERVGGLPFWSPAFVLAVPIVAAGVWRLRRLRRLAVVFVAFLLLTPLHGHYFLAIAPLWCVLAGAAAADLAGDTRRARRALLAGALAIAAGGDAYLVWRVRQLGPPPATADARDRLLASQLPLYEAIAFLNRTAGRAVVYGVNAEQMVGYSAGTLLGDFNGPASYTRMWARAEGSNSLAAALDTAGARYLLVPAAATAWLGLADADPRLSPVYRDPRAIVYVVNRGGG